MRWSRRCRSNQLNHATEGPPVLGRLPPAPGTHPVVAVVSVSPFGPNPPQFNHLSRPKPSPCVGADFADQLNHATEGPPVLGHLHLPQGPIQWWQWSLRAHFGPNPPQFQSCLSRPSHLHALEHTLQIQSSSIMPQGTSSTGRLPPAPGTHPVVAVVSVTRHLSHNSNHLSRPKAISMRWSRAFADQINSIMPQKDPPLG
jgi:hypothetical protein